MSKSRHLDLDYLKLQKEDEDSMVFNFFSPTYGNATTDKVKLIEMNEAPFNQVKLKLKEKKSLIAPENWHAYLIKLNEVLHDNLLLKKIIDCDEENIPSFRKALGIYLTYTLVVKTEIEKIRTNSSWNHWIVLIMFFNALQEKKSLGHDFMLEQFHCKEDELPRLWKAVDRYFFKKSFDKKELIRHHVKKSSCQTAYEKIIDDVTFGLLNYIMKKSRAHSVTYSQNRFRIYWGDDTTIHCAINYHAMIAGFSPKTKKPASFLLFFRFINLYALLNENNKTLDKYIFAQLKMDYCCNKQKKKLIELAKNHLLDLFPNREINHDFKIDMINSLACRLSKIINKYATNEFSLEIQNRIWKNMFKIIKSAHVEEIMETAPAYVRPSYGGAL